MLLEPKCFTRGCKHFIGVNGENEIDQVIICKAFPDKHGIPDEIAYGDNPHVVSYNGDHGIMYEKYS